MRVTSGNPTLSDKAFAKARQAGGSGTMTVSGAIQKSGILLAITIGMGVYSWGLAYPNGYEPGMPPQVGMGWMMGALFIAMIIGFVIIFKQTTAPVLAPVYAALEGFVLGSISAIFDAQYPGIAVQAVFLTFGVLGAMLMLYQSGIIKPTEKFKMGIVAAMGAIFFIYLINFIMGFFGTGIPLIHSNGTFGILFSVGVIIVAALSLILDFDLIEQGANRGAPQYMEWYSAFALLVSLIWLYMEILRLLSKLNSRR